MRQLTQLQVDSIETLCAHDYNASQLQTLIESKKQDRRWNELIFVAETESQIVGFSALSLIDPTLNGIFVHPAFIRQGIATKLLAALENEALKTRIRCLWVSASLNAVAFYQARGYQIVRKNSIWLGSGVSIPVVLMKKVLIPPTLTEIIVTWLVCILLVLFLFSVVLPLLSGGWLNTVRITHNQGFIKTLNLFIDSFT